ncbi:uncharacterized protein LOC114570194 [Perca flavescens]|uniref:uncharacterized protein LOC114570194 n=1 Tax=Perca flavescens TaxID=8167 RepID=UPI00106DFF4F|nr:uncharacterized protein LOC114570194 [Perca flavescens]
MSKVQMLRESVKQRLTAAAEEIFGLFERTIAEYEEERCRSKEENERQRKLLDAVFTPQLRLHRTDVQQLSVREEEVPPEQREWSSSLDQQHPEPPHIKEEQEELWISQKRQQLQGLEEADITKFSFTTVPVKSEDDEKKPRRVVELRCALAYASATSGKLTNWFNSLNCMALHTYTAVNGCLDDTKGLCHNPVFKLVFWS